MKAKKLLALTLALVLCLGCMSISALADDPVGTDLATIDLGWDSTYFVENSDRLPSGNYYLSANLTLDSGVKDFFFSAGTVIDLCGRTLDFAEHTINFDDTLTIKDSVGGGKIKLQSSNAHISSGCLTLQSGTIEAAGNINLNCSLDMTGGSIVMNNKGYLSIGSSSGNVKLTGGTVTSPGANYAIYSTKGLTIGGSFSVPEGIYLEQLEGSFTFQNDLSNTIGFSCYMYIPTTFYSNANELSEDILAKIVATDSVNQKISYDYDSDNKAYTLTLALNLSVNYTKADPYPIVSSKESALDIGDISLKLFDDPASVNYSCTVKDENNAAVETITAKVDTEDGNKLKVTVNDAPAGNYTITVTASNDYDGTASCNIPFVVGTVLDREDSTTDILQSYDIPQTYDLTVTDNGYRDVTKVRLSWKTEEISASSSRGRAWDPDTLKWVDDAPSSTANAVDAEFKLENLSSLKVRAEVSFTRDESFTGDEPTVSFDENSGTADDGKVLLGSVVAQNKTRDVTLDANRSETVAVTLTPTASDFDSLAAGKGTYGNYTVSLKDPAAFPITVNGENFTADAENPATIDEFGSATVKFTADDGYVFADVYSVAGVEASATVSSRSADGKTITVTLYNATADVVLDLFALPAKTVSLNVSATGETNYRSSCNMVGSNVYVPTGSTVVYSESDNTITAEFTYKNGESTYATVTVTATNDDHAIKWDNTSVTTVSDNMNLNIVNA